MTGRPLRALVVDDHPLMRMALRLLAGEIGGVQIVGEAGTGGDAVDLARLLRPELVFMDLDLPEMDGFDAIRAMRATLPDVQILVFTVTDDERAIVAALRAGASGYLVKRATAEEIRNAIGELGLHGSYISPELGVRVLRYLLTGAS